MRVRSRFGYHPGAAHAKSRGCPVGHRICVKTRRECAGGAWYGARPGLWRRPAGRMPTEVGDKSSLKERIATDSNAHPGISSSANVEVVRSKKRNAFVNRRPCRCRQTRSMERDETNDKIAQGKTRPMDGGKKPTDGDEPFVSQFSPNPILMGGKHFTSILSDLPSHLGSSPSTYHSPEVQWVK